MKEIPANCVLNKGLTGCGATTLAIEQAAPTIIAVPYVGLIENKMAQHPDVLGIFGEGDKKNEINQYVGQHPDGKIITTYDSFPKVCSVLTDLGHNPYSD